jgi:hypothetical protein
MVEKIIGMKIKIAVIDVILLMHMTYIFFSNVIMGCASRKGVFFRFH